MKPTKAQRLAETDSQIIDGLQWLTTKTAAVERTALTFAPRTHWWHWLVPRAWRLQPVATAEEKSCNRV